MYGHRERGVGVATRDTKRMFAVELEVMMAAMPLSKVRVAELCARCGVERRVFYYHFKDKYDLVAWMFEQDRAAAAATCGPYTREFYAEAHRLLWDRRDFYRRAFERTSRTPSSATCCSSAWRPTRPRLSGIWAWPGSRMSTRLRRATLRMATWGV